jgi:hypothetical protein
LIFSILIASYSQLLKPDGSDYNALGQINHIAPTDLIASAFIVVYRLLEFTYQRPLFVKDVKSAFIVEQLDYLAAFAHKHIDVVLVIGIARHLAADNLAQSENSLPHIHASATEVIF